MLFDWLNTRNASDFGGELAKLLMEQVPLNIATGETSKLNSKSNYAKEKLQKRIRQFKQAEVLNLFKTSKLLNSFKWTLKDAGYSAPFIESFSAWVFITLRDQNF
ncbi:MAG: hypothetical protein ABIU58_05800 [Ramlibacter sp.]